MQAHLVGRRALRIVARARGQVRGTMQRHPLVGKGLPTAVGFAFGGESFLL
jgi:hypothetical protein